MKIDLDDSLPLDKTLKVFNKDQNHYYFNTFLEKCSYQLAKK